MIPPNPIPPPVLWKEEARKILAVRAYIFANALALPGIAESYHLFFSLWFCPTDNGFSLIAKEVIAFGQRVRDKRLQSKMQRINKSSEEAHFTPPPNSVCGRHAQSELLHERGGLCFFTSLRGWKSGQEHHVPSFVCTDRTGPFH